MQEIHCRDDEPDIGGVLALRIGELLIRQLIQLAIRPRGKGFADKIIGVFDS